MKDRVKRLRKRHPDGPVKTCAPCILCGYNRTDVLYHRFPTDSTRTEWLRVCELPENTSTKNLKICDRHFTTDSKSFGGDGSTTLKEKAIPTLRLDEVYGVNSEDNETPIDASPFTTDGHPVDRLSSDIVDSSSGLNLDNLRRSMKRALQPSATSLNSESENDLNLRNDFGGELVEVVEMKIYRFNRPPTFEGTQSSSRITDLGTESALAIDPKGNDSKSESNLPLMRELEMHSYSKPASAEITNLPVTHYEPLKRQKAPRYFGDLTEDDYLTPTSAKHAWYIARTLIHKKNDKILHIEAENDTLERRSKNLKEVIRQLCLNGSVPLKFRKERQVSSTASNDDHETVALD